MRCGAMAACCTRHLGCNHTRRGGFCRMSQTDQAARSMSCTPLSPPALRARRCWAVCQQALIVLATLAALMWCLWMIRTALARNGIVFDMGFLAQPSGFSISEGWVWTWQGLRSFESSDNNAQALLVGLGNTLKVAVLAIVISTIAGTLLGIARLSRNWLLRQLSFLLIEFVRNTPLLIQLVFWYFAVVLQLPALHDAAHGFGAILASQQGIFLPGLSVTAQASSASIVALVAALLLSAATLASGDRRAASRRFYRQRRHDDFARICRHTAGAKFVYGGLHRRDRARSHAGLA